ncbi:MAG: DUF3048 domain-containing protein [Aggregatilineales bacterium]
MRRTALFALLCSMLISSAVLLAAASQNVPVHLQAVLPGTNTPRPVVFATNTPMRDGPTEPPTLPVTPSMTATPSLTPTPSFTPTETFTLTPSPTPTPIGPLWYPEGVSPLTGQPYPSEEAFNRRNLIVKISNYPPIVRPQSGVNAADVVYEYEVEGGVTRLAAIYRNNAPTHVGPVRSGRLLDIELVPMYQALFAYSGASQPVQRIILSQEWARAVISPSIGDNCVEAGFCRYPGDGLVFEHTLYVNTQMIWERAERRGINTGLRARGFAFNDTPDPGGLVANDIFVNWYGRTDARWQWDPLRQRYVRFTDGLPHFDAADGEQLWADNLIIIEVPHEERPDLFEEESRSASQQINLWDQGRAYLMRDGVYYQGFWRRPCDRRWGDNPPTPTPEGYTVTSPCGSEPGTALQVIYGNGTPMMMKPGRTWVMVVRWLGDVALTEARADMPATATVLAASFTPTYTMTPGPSHTPEATRVPN